MTHVSCYLDERKRVRPSFAPGVREAVITRDTPLGFTNPSCFFCKAAVMPKETAIHHEEPWVRLYDRLLKDLRLPCHQ